MILYDFCLFPAYFGCIQWVPRALFLGVKRPGIEANHSLPSSSEVKECVELYLHSPILLHGVVLSIIIIIIIIVVVIIIKNTLNWRNACDAQFSILLHRLVLYRS
jgi:hypothetical protein